MFQVNFYNKSKTYWYSHLRVLHAFNFKGLCKKDQTQQGVFGLFTWMLSSICGKILVYICSQLDSRHNSSWMGSTPELHAALSAMMLLSSDLLRWMEGSTKEARASHSMNRHMFSLSLCIQFWEPGILRLFSETRMISRHKCQGDQWDNKL